MGLVFKAGVHNIRPAGQMWPAEAFYMAHKAHNLAYLAWLFHKNILSKNKNMYILALEHDNKKISGPPCDLSCAPLV